MSLRVMWIPLLTVWVVAETLANDAGPIRDESPLYLELVINRWRTGSIVPVRRSDGRLYIEAASLAAAGIALDELGPGTGHWLALDELPDIDVRYHAASQQLHLQVAPAHLPHQRLSTAGEPRDYSTPRRDPGIVLNYDLFGHHQQGRGDTWSAFSDLRAFADVGVLRHTGVHRHMAQGTHYLRHSTQWTQSRHDDLRTLRVGDVITAAPGWGRPVRLGGIQWARNFDLRPDLITYPLPDFAGEAALPSALEVLVNGVRRYRGEIQPGTYELATAPYLNGAGQATLMTTDILGRQAITTVDFYVAPRLMTPGLLDYSLTTGWRRERFGVVSNDYGSDLAGSGSLRYGLTRWLTLEAHGETVSGLRNGGAGVITRVGRFGVLDAAYRRSWQPDARGSQASLGYRYSSGRFSLAARYLTRTPAYRDLGTPHRETRLHRREGQLSSSLSLGSAGTLGMGVFFIGDSGDTTRVVNLSYSVGLARHMTLYASANRTLSDDRDTAFSITLNVPFAAYGSAATQYAQDADGRPTRNLHWRRATPPRGGFGWQVSNGAGPRGQRRVGLSWLGRQVRLRAGSYRGSAPDTHYAEASGSLVWMHRRLFAARPIRDAFAVISTNGFADVPVRLSNQPIGTTDRHGYLLVSDLHALGRNKIGIDVLDLPPDARHPATDQWVVPAELGGVTLDFDIRRVSAATLVVLAPDGQPVPVGTALNHLESGRSSVVGWDGLVYLEGLTRDNRLRLQVAGVDCEVHFRYTPQAGDVPFLGALPCVAGTAGSGQ